MSALVITDLGHAVNRSVKISRDQWRNMQKSLITLQTLMPAA